MQRLRKMAPIFGALGLFVMLASSPADADQITLRLRNGQSVQVQDFRKDPRVLPDPNNAGQYIVGPRGQFSIIYFDYRTSFNIGLQNKKLGPARAKAERFLLDLLQLPPSQMCWIDYYLGTDMYTSAKYAGKNLGFSFCPGATRLAGDVALKAPAAAHVPHFTKFMRYQRDVRPLLLKAGWQPVNLRGNAYCGWDTCPPVPEVLSCAGAGSAECIYTWKHGTQLLEVIGTGESEDQPFVMVKRCSEITQRPMPYGWWECKP